MQAFESTNPPATSQISPSKRNRYTCLCCRVKFDSVEQQKCHFKTEWHSYNLKRKVCSLEPIDAKAFQQIQDANPTPRGPDETSSNLNTSSVKAVQSDEDSDEQTLDDDDEWLDEDYTSDEAEEMLARVIKSDTCLFCNLKSKNTERNLNHMNIVHGFFLPEQQYLIDLEGMMEYLGFKVGAGATCLWCNKQFTTLHGVRLHMLYKDHCKIFYDQEKAVEFKEFYDYATQVQIPMRPLNELVIARKPRPKRYSSPINGKLSLSKQSQSLKNQLIKAVGPNFTNCTLTSKCIKKFNAERAKTLLRTGMANNYSLRGRLRNQNPI